MKAKMFVSIGRNRSCSFFSWHFVTDENSSHNCQIKAKKETLSIFMMLSSDNRYKIYPRIRHLLKISVCSWDLEINKVGLNKSLQHCKYTVSGSFSSWGKRPGPTSSLDILDFLKDVIASNILRFSQVLRGKQEVFPCLCHSWICWPLGKQASPHWASNWIWTEKKAQERNICFLKVKIPDLVWRCTPAIPVLRRRRQENFCELEASLST